MAKREIFVSCLLLQGRVLQRKRTKILTFSSPSELKNSTKFVEMDREYLGSRNPKHVCECMCVHRHKYTHTHTHTHRTENE
jgi:hypothetical protein